MSFFRGTGVFLRRSLPYLLLLVPIFSLDLFFLVFSAREAKRVEEKRREEAQNVLEQMVRESRVPWWVERISQALQRRLRGSPGSFPRLPGLKFFPRTKFWLFRIGEEETPSLTPVVSIGFGTSPRSVSRAMAAILARRKGSLQEERKESKIIDFLFGPGLTVSLIAKLQAEVVRVVHEGKYRYLAWDIIRISGRETFIYFLLVEDSPESRRISVEATSARFSGKKLGKRFSRGNSASGKRTPMEIRDGPQARQGPDQRKMGPPQGCPYDSVHFPNGSDTGSGVRFAGFLRRNPGAGANYIPRGLLDQPGFQSWLEAWESPPLVPLASHTLPDCFNLGRNLIFLGVNPGEEIIPFLWLSGLPAWEFPPWVWATNILALLSVLFGAIGLKRNVQLPGISLRSRFVVLFCLVAFASLSLFFIGARLFLEEAGTLETNNLEERIRQAAGDYDKHFERVNRRFQIVLRRLRKDKTFLDSISAEKQDPGFVIRTIAAFLKNSRPSIPFATISFVGMDGEEAATFSSRVNPMDLEGFQAINRAGMRYVILDRRGLKDDCGKEVFTIPYQDRSIAQSLQSVTGQTLLFNMLKTAGDPIAFQTGRKRIWRVLDHLEDRRGRPCCFQVAWRPEDLDLEVGQEAFLNSRKRFPGVKLAFLRMTPSGPIDTTGRGREPIWANDIAVVASRNGREIFRKLPRIQAIQLARPSSENEGIWIVAQGKTTAVERTRRERVRLGVLLFGASLLVIFILNRLSERRLISPIVRLAKDLESVCRGNLSFPAPGARSDEVGRLSSAFHAVVEGLKTRRRLSSLVSGPAMQMICDRMGSLEPGSCEDVEVVSLVSDIRDFTTLCEKHSPREITSLLNRHFDGMSRVITGHGGSVDRFIGDAVNAVFLCPSLEIEKTILQAVTAGARMLEEIGTINSERRSAGLFEYRAGIGISFGRARASILGDTSSRLDLCFLGSPFETAAEMEAATKNVPEFPLVTDATVARVIGRELKISVEPVGRGTEGFTFPSGEEGFRKAGVRGQIPPEGTPVKSDDPMNVDGHAMGGPNYFRGPLGALFISALVLGIPLLTAWWALSSAEMGELDRRQKEARRRNEIFLKKLNRQTLSQEVTEENLDRLVRKVEEGIKPVSHGRVPESLIEGVRKELDGLGAKPLATALIPFDPAAPSSFLAWTDIDEALRERVSSDDLVSLSRELLFSYGLHQQKDTIYDKYDLPLISKGANLFLLSSNRGKLAPVMFASTSSLIYWRPLLRVESFDLLWEKCQTIPDWKRISEDFGGFPPEASPTFLMGAFLTVLSRENETASGIGPALEKLADSPTVGCFWQEGKEGNTKTSVNGGFGLFWPEAAKALGKEGIPPQESSMGDLIRLPGIVGEWAVDGEPTGRPGEYLLAATHIRPEGAGSFLRKRVLGPGMLIGALGLLAFTLWSWRNERGLARSFTRQMLAGVFGAAFVPLTGLFLVLNELGNSWDQNLVQAAEASFQRKVRDFENRVDERFFRLQEALPRMLEKPQPKETGCEADVVRRVGRALTTIRMPPYFVRVGGNVLVLPNGDYVTVGSRGEAASVTQTVLQALGFSGERVQKRTLGSVKTDPGSSPASSENYCSDLVKKELATEEVVDILETSYGAATLLDLTFGQGKLSTVKANLTTQHFFQGFLTSKTKPDCFLAISFNDFSPRFQCTASLLSQDFLAAPPGKNLVGPRLFALERENLGLPVRPEDGERLSFLRPLAALAISEREGFSSWVDDELGTFFAQLAPGRSSPQNFYVEVTPETFLYRPGKIQQVVVFGLMGLVVLALLAISLGMSYELSEPVLAAVDCLMALGAGDYSRRMNIDRADELGSLANSFNFMAKGLQEREVLARFVSSSAREMSSDEKGELEALTGTRRSATVAFFGVPKAGMKSLSSKGSGSRQGSLLLLNQWILAVFGAVGRYGGEVDKVLGDKILAVFPHPPETAGEGKRFLGRVGDACRSALGVLADLRGQGNPLGCHVGIASGEVISGLLGTSTRRDFTVIGDTVNLSARFCSLADGGDFGEIILSEESVREGENGFSFKSIGSFDVKGKSQPLPLVVLVSDPKGAA